VIASRSQFKQLMLTGYLSIIAMIVSIIYAILDITNHVYYSLGGYVVLFCMPLLSLVMIRKNYYRSAKVLLMVSANLVVFWAAINDPRETGAYLFFIASGIGSFAIVTFEDQKTSISLACFTTILFLLAYFGDFKSLQPARPSESYIQLSFMLNYFISMTISVLVVYFLINLNKSSELELIRKENFAQQKNLELQKVNDELDRFVYRVSHDLRSPLSSILGLTNLARLTKDQKELDSILTMIQGRINAQEHFIREIIDYSRNTRTDVAHEKIKLRRLVDEVMEALKYNENAHRIEFRNVVPEDTILVSDRIRLTVILNNLIGNAIKYHDLKKDHPFIEVGHQTAIPALYVKDNGAGIQNEHKGKIFQMFYRGSDRSTGSGLGLFITKEAVTKLNGSIEVSSVHGEGSTFTVHLPDAASNND
jgi:signal transduction histidine kinase